MNGPRLAALVTVALAVLGVPLGLLWAALAPDVPVRVTETGAVFAEPQPQQPIAADAWFVLLALGFGVLAAAGAWRLAVRLRGPAGLLALTAGLLAAGLLGWWVGRAGLAGYQDALPAAVPGTVLDRPADLRVVQARWWPPMLAGVVLVPALSAAVTYTLLAAWSKFPSLRPEQAGVSQSGAEGSQSLDATGQ
jgi:hypothetical protein